MNLPIVNNAPTGDLIWYVVTHWGATPGIPWFVNYIIEGFFDVGLEATAFFTGGLIGIQDAAGAIVAAGIFSDSAIATAMLTFLSSPVGWTVLITIGSFIAAE